MKGIVAGDTKVLLVHTEGRIRAFEDKCPHQGSLLSKGTLQNGIITCARHYWTFSAGTGEGISPKKSCLKKLESQIDEGTICVAQNPG